MSQQAVPYQPPKQRPWSWFGNEIVRPVLRSPAARAYAIVWLAAAAYLAAVGYGDAVLSAALFAAGVLLFCVFTVALTETPPAPEAEAEADAAPRGRLALQALAALFFIAVTGYTSLAFHGLITAEQAHIPIWSPVVGWFGELGARYLDVSLIRSPDNALANPATYFLLPLPVLLLLGARWRALGFGRGHRTGRVLLLWCAIPVAFWLVQIGTGALSLLALAQRLIGHTLQNGPFEEFLFRGALQSRLALLLGTPWALVGQALIFGAWHLGLGTSSMGGDVLAGLALTIVSQSVFGLVAGILFWRTRNLVACSVVHVVLNSFG